mgnify:CR=1 FL=1
MDSALDATGSIRRVCEDLDDIGRLYMGNQISTRRGPRPSRHPTWHTDRIVPPRSAHATGSALHCALHSTTYPLSEVATGGDTAQGSVAVLQEDKGVVGGAATATHRGPLALGCCTGARVVPPTARSRPSGQIQLSPGYLPNLADHLEG